MARERSVSDVCEVLALRWSFRGELCLCISREMISPTDGHKAYQVCYTVQAALHTPCREKRVTQYK